MEHPLYGLLNSNARTVEYTAGADEVWHHAGAHFCFLGSDGFVTQNLTGTQTIFGWAVIPTGTGAGTAVASWQASATEGKDKIPIILASEFETFIVPADDTATVGQAGDKCDITLTSNTGTVAAVANIGTSTHDVLIIQGLATDRVAGAAGTDVLVQMNIANQQAD